MLRLLIILLAVIPAIAGAQSGKGRTCRILFLGAPAGAPEKVHLFDGEASQEVELPQMNLSPVYDLPKGPRVLRLMPNAPASPEEVDPAAPKIQIRENVTDFYLIVSVDPDNKVLPVKMKVIDADSSKFKRGQQLWYNLTPFKVGGVLGSQKLVMDPNSRKVVKAPANGNEDYNVKLSYLKPGDERVFPLCETQWRHDPTARALQFVVTQGGSTTPRVLGFEDHRTAKKEDDQ